jgi:hypothetical protein
MACGQKQAERGRGVEASAGGRGGACAHVPRRRFGSRAQKRGNGYHRRRPVDAQGWALDMDPVGASQRATAAQHVRAMLPREGIIASQTPPGDKPVHDR